MIDFRGSNAELNIQCTPIDISAEFSEQDGVNSRYTDFRRDQSGRKQYLEGTATEVVGKIIRPVKPPRKLFDALGKAVSERRISVWSSSPADQKLLEETPLTHVIPDDPAPYAEVVINNLGGNKMDHYLDPQIEYVADGCNGDTRLSNVTVRLTKTLSDPTSLPDYVAGKLGFLLEARVLCSHW